MGLRSCHDPFGSPTLVVDKLLGTAYEVVRYVAEHMAMLQTMSDNMEDLTLIATNARKEIDLEGTATGLGQTVNIALPEGVSEDDVRWLRAVIYGTDGITYSDGEGTFTIRAQSGAVRVTLAAGGPAGLVNAPISVTVAYRD